VEVWVAAAIFLITYAFIATERVHKTSAALGGGVAMILSGVLTQEQAFDAIDFNVIFLLLGMMVIANVMRTTGVFQWVAVRAVQLAGADLWRILVVLCLITAVASAFLDNVTTVVLVGPVTLYLAAALGVSPVPFLVAEILASNIGGAATLIGDPPNLLIASAAGFDFGEFAWNMAPLSVIVFVGLLVLLRWLMRDELAQQRRDLRLVELDEAGLIGDPARMRRSVAVMALTIVGFFAAEQLHYEPATVALLGATAILVLERTDPAEILARVEWSTLLFFVGLFMAVEGVVQVGLIEDLADALFELTGGEPATSSLALLWVSGIASGIVDNIPYTTTVIPVVESFGARGAPVEPLWWALAIGADLGGNATVVGASANVVIVTLAERAGHRIDFRAYLRYGIPTVVMCLAIGSVYLAVRYLL
jgi:Na+/H+ antiporter NhaD/arsenite permease-like protein